MKRWIKIVIGVVVVICLMVGAFYVGGVVGFMTGSSHKTGITAAVDGVTTVVILRDIREGRTDSAVKLLETILDTKIIAHELLVEEGYSPFDILRMNHDTGKFMVFIAKHRKEYPRESPHGSVIEELLSEYEMTDQE